MSRTLWAVVGAVGGIVAYRRGARAAQRAKELGPLGSAQVVAQGTSSLAGRTAHGIARLQDARARREGRLLTGTAEEVIVPAPVALFPVPPVPPDEPDGLGQPREPETWRNDDR